MAPSRLLCALVALGLTISTATAAPLPQGGHVTNGDASISKTLHGLNIDQTTNKAVIDWTQFNVGDGYTVRFQQPDSDAMTLNRVIGGDMSKIDGRIVANGQVWLLNPNGVLFGNDAQVQSSGFLAATLGIDNDAFMNGDYTLSGNTGRVLNKGTIMAEPGGYVALIGGHVTNNGLIEARLGGVTLAAGNRVTLQFAGDNLVNVSIDRGALDALVENNQIIRAGGGNVLMTAQAVNDMMQSVVNNAGLITARTAEKQNGTIKLLAGMQNGTVNVDGRLDASADSGDGGFIETSAAHVNVADAAEVTTASKNGKTGTWLIDPKNYLIARDGGDTTGAALSDKLETNNVVIESQSGKNGSDLASSDIIVNDGIEWNAGTSLTLNATNDIVVNSKIAAHGNNAGLALNAYSGYDTSHGGVKVNAPIVLDGNDANLTISTYDTGFSGRGSKDVLDVDSTISMSGKNQSVLINGHDYTIIDSIDDFNETDSQYIVVVNDIDATQTATSNDGKGFAPYSSTGGDVTLEGFGHTIKGLSINRSDRTENTGMIVKADAISNIKLSDVEVDAASSKFVGSLAGVANSVYNVHVDGGKVTGGTSGEFTKGGAGGIVGKLRNSAVKDGVSNISIASEAGAGGIAARASSGGVGSAIDSFADNIEVKGSGGPTGGLFGWADTDIKGSHVLNSKIAGGDYTGGIAGYSQTIANSYAEDTTIVGDNYVGGLVGKQTGNRHILSHVGSINLYAADVSVTGNKYVGGVAGETDGAFNVVASGTVKGNEQVGGTIGVVSRSGVIENVVADTNVSANNGVGGVIANVTDDRKVTIRNAYWNTDKDTTDTSGIGLGLSYSELKDGIQSGELGFEDNALIERNGELMLSAFMRRILVEIEYADKEYDGEPYAPGFVASWPDGTELTQEELNKFVDGKIVYSGPGVGATEVKYVELADGTVRVLPYKINGSGLNGTGGRHGTYVVINPGEVTIWPESNPGDTGPDIDTPDIDTPDIDTPDIDTPDIDTPDIGDDDPVVTVPSVKLSKRVRAVRCAAVAKNVSDAACEPTFNAPLAMPERPENLEVTKIDGGVAIRAQ